MIFDIIKIRFNNLINKTVQNIKKIVYDKPKLDLEEMKISKDEIYDCGFLINTFEGITEDCESIEKILELYDKKSRDINDFLLFIDKFETTKNKFLKYLLYTPQKELKNEQRIVDMFSRSFIDGDLQIVDGKLTLPGDKTVYESEDINIEGEITKSDIVNENGAVRFDIEYYTYLNDGLTEINKLFSHTYYQYNKLENIYVYAVELSFSITKGLFLIDITPEIYFEIANIKLNNKYIYEGIVNGKNKILLNIPEDGNLVITLIQRKGEVVYEKPAI